MNLIGHRGCAGQFPENTIEAVHSCADYVDRVEIDVRRCGSGELVVFHTDDLSKRTDATGQLHATALEECQSASVLGTDLQIPTLSALLDAVPSDLPLQIDLKHAGLTDNVKDLVAGVDNDISLCSTIRSELEAARSLEWSVPIGFVSFPYFQNRPVSDREVRDIDYSEALATALELDCSFIEIPAKLCLQTDVVNVAHQRGLHVLAWTIDTEERAIALREAGVDELMVNRYDVL